MTEPARRFIRHTIDVPLVVTASGVRHNAHDHGVNVSHGGLAFSSDACLDIGAIIELSIPTVDPPFDAHARVVWCRPEGANFLVGVEFLDKSDAFRSRMVEQVCTIEGYRRQVLEHEGRELTAGEAGLEWITKFAGRFPHADEHDAAS